MHIINRIKAVDIIDDRDAYLNPVKITIQESKKHMASLYSMNTSDPNRVATPFPPLNSSHTGKICPIIENKADIKTKVLSGT